MSTASDKFWANDPNILFEHILEIFPTKDMSLSRRLNALTRLIIIIAIVMYVTSYEFWFMFITAALLVVVLLRYGGADKEGFSVTPTYNNPDVEQIMVSPLFAEEWQIPPPAYDIYSEVPPALDPGFQAPLKPQNYPYGQYLTSTNLLPSDEYATRMLNGNLKDAREYVNSSFLRNDLSFRDNISRVYKKSLQRRFKHNTADTFSPYQSY